MRSYDDERIKIFTHTRRPRKRQASAHVLASENFDNALRHASGDIIILCDQDDVWLPGRVDRMVEALEYCDLVLCNFNDIDRTGRIVRHGSPDFPSPIRKTFVGNLWRMPFFGSAMAFRRNIQELALPFPRNTSAHDNWIGLIAFATSKVDYISEPLHNYRRHESNVTRCIHNSLFHKISYRLRLAINLALRIITRRYR